MTRRPTAASYQRLLRSVKQAEANLDKARRKHWGQRTALFYVKKCQTQLLKYEQWAKQFNVPMPPVSQMGLPLTKEARG